MGRLILQQLPRQQARPRYCNTVVSLDHFKFTDGLLTSLQRVRIIFITASDPLVIFLYVADSLFLFCTGIVAMGDIQEKPFALVEGFLQVH